MFKHLLEIKIDKLKNWNIFIAMQAWAKRHSPTYIQFKWDITTDNIYQSCCWEYEKSEFGLDFIYSFSN